MSMLSLPNETLLEVFQYLDLLCAVKTVSRVCKLWRILSQDPLLFSALDFTCGPLGRQLNDTLFKKAINLCPRLKAINMSSTHITNTGLEIIIRSCPELETIDCSSCMRLKNAKFESLLALPSLRSVNLLGTWKVTDPYLTPLTPFFERNIQLALTVEIVAPSNSFTVKDEELMFIQLQKLGAIDLHFGHELARNFLESPHLPSFSSTITELEIGSRFTSSTISQLPSQIGLLTSLKSLSIVSHNLQELPLEIIALTNLKSLLISSSRGFSTFSSLPPQIIQLHKLETLNLCWNRMAELPASIMHMTSLKRLNLSNNLLEHLPEELGTMTQLRRLNIAENRLRALPQSMAGLKSLERLNIAHNSVTHIPDDLFAGMKNICSVDVQFNKLTALPYSVANSSVQELIANNNAIEAVPFAIGTQMHQLKKLVLNDNRISDFPTVLEGLSESLKLLSLSGNLLEKVPRSIGNLKNLRVLLLSHNRLNELPPTVQFLRNLRRVELQSNRFSNLASLQGIQGVDTLKSVHFDEYLQEDHSEMCMCKFCVFSRFDEAHFEEIVEGDSDFEEELINLFFNCMENDFTHMSKAFKDNAFEDMYFISHKIKGALSNMGAVKLSHVCSLLEGQARQNNFAACHHLYEKLKLEYAHIKHVLVRRLQRCGKHYSNYQFSVPMMGAAETYA